MNISYIQYAMQAQMMANLTNTSSTDQVMTNDFDTLLQSLISQTELAQNGNTQQTSSIRELLQSTSNVTLPVTSGDAYVSNSSIDSLIEEAGSTYNVDTKLIHSVIQAESGYNQNAVSQAGAQGFMQLMPTTAQSLGVTDAFDARQNIFAGTQYLSQMLTKYNGNKQLALAAYNAGPGNVDKHNGVPPFNETQNYVKKVLGNYFA